jgi:hypothetical protein
VHTMAVHALRIGNTPGALFVAKVQAHDWNVLTDEEEQEAWRRVRQYDQPVVTRNECMVTAARSQAVAGFMDPLRGREREDLDAEEPQWRQDFERLREAIDTHHCGGEDCAACMLFDGQARVLERRWHMLQADEGRGNRIDGESCTAAPDSPRAIVENATRCCSMDDSGSPRERSIAQVGRNGPTSSGAPGPRGGQETRVRCAPEEHDWLGDLIKMCLRCEGHHPDCQCPACDPHSPLHGRAGPPEQEESSG